MQEPSVGVHHGWTLLVAQDSHDFFTNSLTGRSGQAPLGQHLDRLPAASRRLAGSLAATCRGAACWVGCPSEPFWPL